MARATLVFFSLLLTLILPALVTSTQKHDKQQAYIVYFGEHRGDKAKHEIEAFHHSYLLSVKDTAKEAKASLLYSYKHSINGFAAFLTQQEAAKLNDLNEVVSVIPSQEYTLHTTRSWEFSSLEEENPKSDDLISLAKSGENVIVGMFDSGVWPESQSFDDKGMPPVPKSWKGICQTGPGFESCNKKIIGARYYLNGYESVYGRLDETQDHRSPCDTDGHGSHTASTVGGRRVYNIAYNGVAEGTATGGAPRVRLAIYKVCWPVPNRPKLYGNTCFNMDILAAMDDAIADGVNVMSLSLGTMNPYSYTSDAVAIGALHALKKQIVVSASAGNGGPSPATMANVAPWIITVAANTLDREFYSNVVLEDGQTFVGMSLASEWMQQNKMYPLVFAGDITNPHVPEDQAGQCLQGFLSPNKTRGKIVLCERGRGEDMSISSLEVKRAGGSGMILTDVPELGTKLTPYPHFIAATSVSYDDANTIFNYINSTANARANIQRPTTVFGNRPAPEMAEFSSRGPSRLDPYILKPDITAPGVNILAAWSGEDSPTKLPRDVDSRVVRYNLLSGTSMSCPHVASAAALLKGAHPDWSSAAIRSALMTTATTENLQGMPITEETDGSISTPFSYGSGHFLPSTAVDPGLVYDANYTDYLNYLCGQGVTNVDDTFNCPAEPLPAYNLNYPSIAIPDFSGSITVERTVTNVGQEGSVYNFFAQPPPGISMMASPNVLQFDRVGQKMNFTITMVGDGLLDTDENGYSFGWYAWNDGIHAVRSPVAVSLA